MNFGKSKVVVLERQVTGCKMMVQDQDLEIVDRSIIVGAWKVI